jgi:hypothetical protein
MKPFRRLLASLVVCFAVVVIAGCGGGGSDGSTQGVTRSQLAGMVLPKSALGANARGMRINRESGYLSNARAAATDMDPRMTRNSLSRGGRLFGYALVYRLGESEFEDALLSGAGLVQTGTLVDLYRDKAAASSHQRTSVNDLLALVGKPIKDGATLERASTFNVGRIADAVIGVRFAVRINRLVIYYTEVAFHRSSLLAGVFEVRADAKNVDAAVVSVANKLDQRIRRVLNARMR